MACGISLLNIQSKSKQNQEEKKVCDLPQESCKGNSRGANAPRLLRFDQQFEKLAEVKVEILNSIAMFDQFSNLLKKS